MVQQSYSLFYSKFSFIYKKIFALGLLFVVVFSSCNKTEDVGFDKYILLSKSNISVDANSTTKKDTLVVKTNVAIEVNTSVSWITLKKITETSTQQSFEIVCDENLSPTYRYGFIEVKSGDVKEVKKTTVYQLGTEKTLLAIMSDTIFEDNDFSYKTLSIISNIPWQIRVDSAWLKVHYLEGEKKLDIPVITDFNMQIIPRKSRIVISSLDPIFKKDTVINIVQKRVRCDARTNNCPLPPTGLNIIEPENGGVFGKNDCLSFLDLMVIRWNKATDPEGQNTTYNLYIDTKPNPKTLIEGGINANDTNYVYDFTNLLAGDYYLRIEALDASGNATNQIIKFTRSTSNVYRKASQKNIAGGKGSGSGADQFNYPTDIYVTKDRTVFVMDAHNNRVQRWANGASTGETVAVGPFDGAEYIFYRDGFLYISGRNRSNCIFKWRIDKNKIYPYDGINDGVVVAGVKGNAGSSNDLKYIADPTGLYVTATGVIYVCDQPRNRVLRFEPGQTTGVVIAGDGFTGNGVRDANAPHNVYADINDENVYIADEMSDRILKWTKSTNKVSVFASVTKPRSIIVDACNNVYVLSGAGQLLGGGSNQKVLKFSNNGQTQEELIEGQTFSTIYSMGISESGEIYLSDHANNSIIRITR